MLGLTTWYICVPCREPFPGCTMEEVIRVSTRILETLSTGSQSMRSREGKVDGKLCSAAEEMKI